MEKDSKSNQVLFLKEWLIFPREHARVGELMLTYMFIFLLGYFATDIFRLGKRIVTKKSLKTEEKERKVLLG